MSCLGVFESKLFVGEYMVIVMCTSNEMKGEWGLVLVVNY